MRQFTTGDLNKQVGDVTDAAAREPVSRSTAFRS
jgi:hypothetical protein